MTHCIHYYPVKFYRKYRFNQLSLLRPLFYFKEWNRAGCSARSIINIYGLKIINGGIHCFIIWYGSMEELQQNYDN